MINNIVSTLFTLIFKVLAFIGNLILLPITLIIRNLFPDVSSYLETFESFFNTYIFPGIAFVREVFFNLTHFPRSLFAIGIGFILAVWTARLGLYVFRFVASIWKFFRKGDTT